MKFFKLIIFAILLFSTGSSFAQCGIYNYDRGWRDGYALGLESNRTEFDQLKSGRSSCTDYIGGLTDGYSSGLGNREYTNNRPEDPFSNEPTFNCRTVVFRIFGVVVGTRTVCSDG